MTLGLLVILNSCVVVSALTVNQPLLSRGTGAQEDSESWGDEPESLAAKTQLATEADPYEISYDLKVKQPERICDPELEPCHRNQQRKEHDAEHDAEEERNKEASKQHDLSGMDPALAYKVPFNLTNGACNVNKNPRFVMELKNVDQGSYYIGKIGFGTPAQTFNMLLDTGSDEIVSKGKGCNGCKGRGFDRNASSTYHNSYHDNTTGLNYDPKHGHEEISYGSGAVEGVKGKDRVSMGHLSGDDMDLLVVESTTIGEFADVSEDALEVIVGMAPGLPEYTGDKLASHMQVRHFSECLPINTEENGFFVVNDDHPVDKGFNGPFPSMGNFYWALGVQDFRLDFKGVQGKTQKRIGTRSFSALADTGTTLLSVPQSVLDGLESALNELDYDCSQMDKLPDLVFDIEGVTHKLPPSTYIAESSGSMYDGYGLKEKENTGFSRVSAEQRANYYFKHKDFVNKKSGARCELLFTDPISMNSTLGEIGILGMPFFRNYIISFDFCTRQIWTKPSTGDCSHAVGQSPSNKDVCSDDGGNWFSCLMQKIMKWLKENILDGLASIFTENKQQHSGPTMKLKVGSERMSQMAKWLVKGEKETIVEI